MNNVALIGRIGRKNELKTYGKKKDGSVISINVAINEGKDLTTWVTVTAFGKTAEVINQYFDKGERIGITGRLVNNEWEDEKGVKHSKVEVIANQVDFIEPAEK